MYAVGTSVAWLALRSWGDHVTYSLVMTSIAMKNGYLQSIFPLNMVIFHRYVSHYQRGMGNSNLA